MPIIAPFRALRYNAAAVGDLSKVVAPPYDVISPDEQEALYAAHPHNVVRLILAKDAPDRDRYQSAARDLAEWIARGVLAPDPAPAIYPYAQRFTLATGEERTRSGFIALVRLEDFGKGVKAHERTLAAPREDRYRLMTATSANLSQVFALYRDPKREVDAAIESARGEPVAQFRTADAVWHTLWRLTDPEAIRGIAARLLHEPLVIADGHHRYETALRYRDEMRRRYPDAPANASFEYMTLFLCNTADPGLVILPTHRLLRPIPGFDPDVLANRLGEYFRISERLVPAPNPAGARSVARTLREHAEMGPTFAVAAAKRPTMLVATVKPNLDLSSIPAMPASPALRKLDVVALHAICLQTILGLSPEEIEKGGPIAYVKDFAEAIARSRTGEEFAAAFLLPATHIDHVYEVAEAGERMPQKSTFFYPKILSGLALRKIDPREEVSDPVSRE
jgi:uncharacterized protein (DUF1015 family)